MIEYHNEKIEDYLKELAKNDIAENEEKIKIKLEKAKAKKLECEETLSEMESEGIKEKSLIDNDSCRMGTANKGTDRAYRPDRFLPGFYNQN